MQRTAASCILLKARLRHTNHNGIFFSEESAPGRPGRYGYGPFETMLVRDGAIRFAQYHWARLLSAAKILKMQLPLRMDATFLEKEVLRTVVKNGLEQLARVRLQLYKDNGGLLEKAGQDSGFVIECFAIEEHVTQLNEEGLTTGFAMCARKIADAIATLKTSGAHIYSMAAGEAARNHWHDALLQNTTGAVIESTIANLFWVKGSAVCTPPLGDGCVAGVMRAYLLEHLPKAGITVQEQTTRAADLEGAESVFLTNAVRGVRWVRQLAGRSYGCGIAKDIAAQIARH